MAKCKLSSRTNPSTCLGSFYAKKISQVRFTGPEIHIQLFFHHFVFLLGNEIGLYCTDDHRRVIQLLKNRIKTNFQKSVILKRKFLIFPPVC